MYLIFVDKFGMGISIAPTSIGYFKSQSIVELHDNIKCTFANITPEGDILVTGNTESITIFEVKYDEYGYIEKLEVLHFIEDFCGYVGHKNNEIFFWFVLFQNIIIILSLSEKCHQLIYIKIVLAFIYWLRLKIKNL